MTKYFSDKERSNSNAPKGSLILTVTLLLVLGIGIVSFFPDILTQLTGYAVLDHTRVSAGDAGDNDSTTYYFSTNNTPVDLKTRDPTEPDTGVPATASDFGDRTNSHDIYIITERDFLDSRIDAYLSDLGWNAEEKDLSDGSLYWENNLTPYETVFIDYDTGRFKLPNTPLSPDNGTGTIEFTDYVEGCKIAWPDNAISAVNVTTDGMLDGTFIRVPHTYKTPAYYKIVSSNTSAPWLSNAERYSSIQVVTVNQTSGSTGDFGTCVPFTNVNDDFRGNALPIFNEWGNDIETVQTTYKIYKDKEGPRVPTVWPIGDSVNRTTTKTIQIYGYTGERNSTVNIDVLQNYSSYQYRNYTQFTAYQTSELMNATVDQYAINKGEQIFFISDTTNATLTDLANYDYIEFPDYQKDFFLYYTINGTPQRIGNYTRIQLMEPLEHDIPIGAEMILHDTDRPTGWFNQTVELFENVSKIFVYADDYLGNQGDSFVKYLYYYPESIETSLVHPADDTTFNNLNAVSLAFKATSNTSSSFECQAFVNDDVVYSNPTLINGTLVNTTVTNLTVGTYDWHVECFDDHLFVSPTYSFEIIDTISPIIRREFNDYQSDSNLTLTFNITDLIGIEMPYTKVNLSRMINGTSQTITSYDMNAPELTCSGDEYFQRCTFPLDSLNHTAYNLMITAEDVESQVTVQTRPLIIDETEATVHDIVVAQTPYTNKKEIDANWTCVDNVSGIKESTYAIGTAMNETKIKNWTTIPVNGTEQYTSNFTITEQNLSFIDRTDYYVYVQCENNAREKTAITASKSVLFVDITAPDQPIVVDEGMYTSSNTLLYFEWIAQDNESDIHHYEVQLGEVGSPGSVFGWTDVGLATNRSFSNVYSDGNEYSLQVRAVSTNGQISTIGESNGIIVDGTPPVNGSITYAQRSNTDENTIGYDVGVDPISSIKNATLHIYKSDIVNDQNLDTCSGDFLEIRTVRLNESATAINQTLENGCYKFRMRVNNYAGLEREYSIPRIMRLDHTAPEEIIIDDGGVWTSNHSLTFSFKGIDPETHITNYTFSIGSVQENRTDMYNWTTVPADIENEYTTVTINETELNKPLVNGEAYYLTIIATNNASLNSERYFSDGIVWLDKDIPETRIHTFEGNPVNDTNQTFYDTNNDTFTSIVIKTENDTVCKIYEQDVHYQQESGYACTLIPENDSLRDCVIYLPYDGYYERHISCKDQLNNQQTADDNLDISFYVDGYPPEITPLTPLNETFVSGPTYVSAEIIDEGIGVITETTYSLVDATNTTVQNGSLVLSHNDTYEAEFEINETTPDGSYEIRIQARDKANLTGTEKIPVKIDHETPTIDLRSPLEDFINHNTLFNMTISDRLLKNISYTIQHDSTGTVILNQSNTSIDESTVIITEPLNVSSLSEGLYKIQLQASDYNNHTASHESYFFIDRTAPTQTNLTVEPETVYATEDINIESTWSDNAGLEEITLSHTALGNNSTTYSIDGEKKQTNTLTATIDNSNLEAFQNITWYICAEDVAGNTHCTENATITIENQPPKVYAETPSEYEIAEDATLFLDMQDIFYDPEEQALSWSITNTTNSSYLNATLENDTVTVQPIQDWNGHVYLTLQAQDPFTQIPTYFTLEITVTPVNDAPRLRTQIPPVTIVTDATTESYVNLSKYISDPEENQITYNYTYDSERFTMNTTQIGNDKFLRIRRENEKTTGRFTYTIDAFDQTDTASFTGTVIYLNDTTIDLRDVFVQESIQIQNRSVTIVTDYLPTYPITDMTITITTPNNLTDSMSFSQINETRYSYNYLETEYNNTQLPGTYQVTTALTDSAGNTENATTHFTIYPAIMQTIRLA
jgi:hypothetical protein